MTDAVAGYTAAAPRLIAAWQGIAPAALLAPVADHLPRRGQRCLDIGAGSGTVAAHLATRGVAVTAVEPCAPLRAHGQRTTGPGVTWIDSRLPALPGVGGRFDTLLLSAIWHHLPPADRPAAARRVAALATPSASLILSLRHGPTPTDRPGWPCAPAALVADFPDFTLVHEAGTASLQPGNRANGVTWTWLVLRRTPAAA